MDRYSSSYAEIADKVWSEEFGKGEFFIAKDGEKIGLNEEEYYRRQLYPLKGGKKEGKDNNKHRIHLDINN